MSQDKSSASGRWPECKGKEAVDVEAILEQRGEEYGEYSDIASVAQGLKINARAAVGYNRLSYDQAEAVDMVLHKLARILNGNPNHRDSWQDMIGYLKLVEERLPD